MNPYPGIRPYLESDAHLYFGGEYQVDSVLRRMTKTRFIVFTGPSGCGKTSLCEQVFCLRCKLGF